MPPTARETAIWEQVKALRLKGVTWTAIIAEVGGGAFTTAQSYRRKTPGEDHWPVFGATVRHKAYMQYGKLIRPLAEGHP